MPKRRSPPRWRRGCAISTSRRSTPTGWESCVSATPCAAFPVTPTCCPPRWGGSASPCRRGVLRTPAHCPTRSVSTTATTGPCVRIEQSLLRLGANRIDIALIHDIDPFTHGSEAERRRREAMDGAYPALCALRSQGVVNAVGIGANDWRVMEACAREADFDCFLLAIQYTLLRQECLESFLPLCQSRRIPVIVGAPFGSGLLARGSGRGPGNCDYPARGRRDARAREGHRRDLCKSRNEPPCRRPALSPRASGRDRGLARPPPCGARRSLCGGNGRAGPAGVLAGPQGPGPDSARRPGSSRTRPAFEGPLRGGYSPVSNPGTLNSQPGLSATMTRTSSSDTPVLATMTSHSRSASTGGANT